MENEHSRDSVKRLFSIMQKFLSRLFKLMMLKEKNNKKHTQLQNVRVAVKVVLVHSNENWMENMSMQQEHEDSGVFN